MNIRSENRIDTVEVLEEFSIASGTFNEVVLVKYIPGGENPTGISAEYWAPNVGMVRREYFDGYYKELIEYNVTPLNKSL